MNENHKKSVFDDLDEKINLAVKKALERHKKLGESVVISEDGEIKSFTGEEIQILLDRSNFNQ